MAKAIPIGYQEYNELIENQLFYIDKTHFIREWWDSRDKVTLITRPRRFGKSLTMSITKQFFSVKYAGRSDLFQNYSVWESDFCRYGRIYSILITTAVIGLPLTILWKKSDHSAG